MRIPLFVAALLSLAGMCSAEPSLPGCEPRPEVRQVLREKLRAEDLDKLKYTDRVARQHEVLDDLIAKYPREVEFIEALPRTDTGKVQRYILRERAKVEVG